LIAASLVGTPSFFKIADTWVRTVVAETKSPLGDLGGRR